MVKITLLVLCGLPGSGKTTLSNYLHQLTEGKNSKFSSFLNKCVFGEASEHSKTCCIKSYNVCFDLLITDKEIDFTDIDVHSAEGMSQWKLCRQTVLYCVKKMISQILAKELIPVDIQQSKEVTSKFCKNVYSFVEPLKVTEEDVLVIIDDNMYYKSMRYEYYQLARENSIGFAEIYIDCPLRVALQQNLKREKADQVTENIIRNMLQKLEPPSKSEVWEENSLCIKFDEIGTPSVTEHIIKLIVYALDNPVLKIDGLDEVSVAESRLVCSKNLLHQSDQILRQLVGIYMKDLKGKADKSEVQTKAKSIGKIKAKILNNIEEGLFKIKLDEKGIIDSSKNTTSDLYRMIENIFQTEIDSV